MTDKPINIEERAAQAELELARLHAVEEAREEGRVACQAGRALEENPHRETDLAAAWAEGWVATDVVWCLSHLQREAVRLSAEREKLAQRVAELEREAEEEGALRERMSSILTRTATALKGEPAELAMHSWHDLPEKAAELKQRALEACAFLIADHEDVSDGHRQRLHQILDGDDVREPTEWRAWQAAKLLGLATEKP